MTPARQTDRTSDLQSCRGWVLLQRPQKQVHRCGSWPRFLRGFTGAPSSRPLHRWGQGRPQKEATTELRFSGWGVGEMRSSPVGERGARRPRAEGAQPVSRLHGSRGGRGRGQGDQSQRPQVCTRTGLQGPGRSCDRLGVWAGKFLVCVCIPPTGSVGRRRPGELDQKYPRDRGEPTETAPERALPLPTSTSQQEGSRPRGRSHSLTEQ